MRIRQNWKMTATDWTSLPEEERLNLLAWDAYQRKAIAQAWEKIEGNATPEAAVSLLLARAGL